jgi:hypothetical protein
VIQRDAITRAVRAGLESDDVTGAVVPPIHLSSTYAFRGYADKRAYDYSRSGNPTRDLLAAPWRIWKAVCPQSSRLRHGRRDAVSAGAAAASTRRGAARLLWRLLSSVRRAAPTRRHPGRLRQFRRSVGTARRAVQAGRAAVDRDAQQSLAATDGHAAVLRSWATPRVRWWRWTTHFCRRPGNNR